jgi:hypothetical protein
VEIALRGESGQLSGAGQNSIGRARSPRQLLIVGGSASSRNRRGAIILSFFLEHVRFNFLVKKILGC